MGGLVDWINIKKRLRIFVLSRLGYCLLMLIRATCTFKFDVHPDAAAWVGEKPYILVFWHNRQLMMPWIYLLRKTDKSPPIYTLVSEHSDGRIIAELTAKMGIRSVAGSSSSGGRRALTELIKIIKHGDGAGITPDGPKGPKYKLKEGVVLLAKATGIPIYPGTFSAKRCWIFRSWDNIFLPKPFSEVHFYVGKPLYVDPNCDAAEFSKIAKGLEEQMLNETKALDEKIFGRLI